MALAKQVPFAEFEHHTVIFPPSARADMEIRHNMKVRNPESVRWIVTGWGFASPPVETPFIYKDMSAARRPWQPNLIRLRCNVGSAACHLLLFTEV